MRFQVSSLYIFIHYKPTRGYLSVANHKIKKHKPSLADIPWRQLSFPVAVAFKRYLTLVPHGHRERKVNSSQGILARYQRFVSYFYSSHTFLYLFNRLSHEPSSELIPKIIHKSQKTERMDLWNKLSLEPRLSSG